MSLVAEQATFLLDACKLIEFATAQGFVVTGGELLRTVEQEMLYVKQGRSSLKDVNKCNHLRRLAIDLNFFKDGKLVYDKVILQPIGDYWQSLNPKNSWGGNWKSFKDIPHFERRA